MPVQDFSIIINISCVEIKISLELQLAALYLVWGSLHSSNHSQTYCKLHSIMLFILKSFSLVNVKYFILIEKRLTTLLFVQNIRGLC